MQEWFTVEEIDHDTYAISEYQHWEKPHCYLLCGTDQAMLIDTGLGVANIRSVAEKLTNLPIWAAVTHAHWDHIGGLSNFDHIAVHEAEETWLSGQFPLPLSVVKDSLTRHAPEFPEDFCIDQYRIFHRQPQRLLHDGETISLGDRQVTVLHTPGHAPGHCCFYEPARKYLYSGDLVYQGCLDAFYPTTDPRQFWQSIQKVLPLPVHRILPGHHSLSVPADLIRRIDKAFDQISHQGALLHGSGVFPFDDFAIHL